MADVFINYRTVDAAPYAASVYEFLKDRFGEDRVFRDAVSLPPGDLSPEAIRRELLRAEYGVVPFTGRADELSRPRDRLATALLDRPAERGAARLPLLARSAGVWRQYLRRHRDDRVALLFGDVAARRRADGRGASPRPGGRRPLRRRPRLRPP